MVKNFNYKIWLWLKTGGLIVGKYIIDVPDEGKYRLGQAYIFANDGKRIAASCNLADLTPYTEPDKEQIEDEVWEFAWEVLQLDLPVFREIFGYDTDKMDYREYKSKYEAWKREKDKIRVGDEVKVIEVGSPCVVCGIVDGTANLIFGKGDLGQFPVDKLIKTGRHFPEVEELLKKMGEESE